LDQDTVGLNRFLETGKDRPNADDCTLQS